MLGPGGIGRGVRQHGKHESFGVPKGVAVVAGTRQALAGNGATFGPRAGLQYVKQAEADGLLFVKKAEAEGIQSVLSKKAAGFRDLIDTCGGAAGAQNMLITEQLPNIVREQVNAISNLKIDKVTVWDGGKNADGKTGTADFLSGIISALPPLHELARNAGLDLPTYL